MTKPGGGTKDTEIKGREERNWKWSGRAVPTYFLTKEAITHIGKTQPSQPMVLAKPDFYLQKRKETLIFHLV